jgi:hypothetical protein
MSLIPHQTQKPKKTFPCFIKGNFGKLNFLLNFTQLVIS